MTGSRERLVRELARRVLVLAPAGRGSLEAGADIVITPDPSEAAGARAAANEFGRRDASFPRFVAGWIDASADDCASRALALLDRGADILWLDAGHDPASTKTGLLAVRDLLDERSVDTPLILSVAPATIARSSLAGGSIAQASPATPRGARMPETGSPAIDVWWTALRHADPVVLNLDLKLVLNLDPGTDPICDSNSAHAGAGPLLDGLTSLSPLVDTFVAVDGAPLPVAASLAEHGLVNALACGPHAGRETIARLSRIAHSVAPRPIPSPLPSCRLSGREILDLGPGSPFIKIGERANVCGSAAFARLVREGRREEALAVARRQIDQGAHILDLNLDDPRVDAAAEMAVFVSLLSRDPIAGRVPLMIDSADWNVIEAGVRRLPGRGIANSITLKDGEEEFVRRARRLRRLGAVPVVVALDDRGPAVEAARKAEVCLRGFRLATERAGFPPQDIVLDPAILAVGTGLPEHDETAVAYLEACRILRARLPQCPISGGVSNLSFAFRGSDRVRDALHAVFLRHAAAAGMNMGIVNVARWVVYESLPVELREAAEDVVLHWRPDAAIRLARLARRMRAEAGRTADGGSAGRGSAESGPAEGGLPPAKGANG